MPATVQRPMATPPCCLTTALTRRPPTACSNTGIRVDFCQPRRALEGPSVPPLSMTKGTPHKASSRLNSALGRVLPAMAACDRAAAVPEQAAVPRARAVPAPEETFRPERCSEGPTSLPQPSPLPSSSPVAAQREVGELPERIIGEQPTQHPAERPPPPPAGVTNKAPAETAQKSAAHCCSVWPSPSRIQAAKAQKTTFVWLKMLKVTPSHRR
mmetsp:Transcript_42426/g.132441  ORF Transcript_42426/g.132441 Transcript_42426/m.132441 type:complete len:213 (+) Transcript_42426:213-851(+)